MNTSIDINDVLRKVHARVLLEAKQAGLTEPATATLDRNIAEAVRCHCAALPSQDDLSLELDLLKFEIEELSTLVHIDGLTKAYNHRYFYTHLERELSKAQRHKRPLSLLMCNIDFFKEFNELHGNQAGDSVLRTLAQLLTENVRIHDIISRSSGDIFAVILSETTLDEAIFVAEKLRKTISETPFIEEDQSFSITVSFGVACYDSSINARPSLPELIHNAETAVKQAKNNGRNCTSANNLDRDAEASSQALLASAARVIPRLRPKILIVDDSSDNIDILVNILSEDYDLRVAKDGATLFTRLKEGLPDLILLDIMMPDIDGYEICSRLKNEPEHSSIPIILVTALSQVEDEIKGLSLGAFDYVTRPISPPILKMRIKNCMHLQQHKYRLEELVAQRTCELEEAQDATIECMAAVAESRDSETAKHTTRCRDFMEALALELSHHLEYAAILTPDIIESLRKAAPLHDIGKVGIPDRILQKTGKLTEEEFEVMKQHTTIGQQAIHEAEKQIGDDLLFLKIAKEIAFSHHEKWDGSGYPQGLQKQEIPLSARLMAVVDVYDALTSERRYKPAIAHSEAVSIIYESSGSHFDPEIVKAFLRIQEKFLNIKEGDPRTKNVARPAMKALNG